LPLQRPVVVLTDVTAAELRLDDPPWVAEAAVVDRPLDELSSRQRLLAPEVRLDPRLHVGVDALARLLEVDTAVADVS
jgi:hypothetical protein